MRAECVCVCVFEDDLLGDFPQGWVLPKER